MRKKQRAYLKYGGLGVALVLLYLQMSLYHSTFFGTVAFVVYVISLVPHWRRIYARLFGIKPRSFVSLMISAFTVIALLGLVSGIWAVWYTMTPEISWSVYLIVALLSITPSIHIRKKTRIKKEHTVRVHIDKQAYIRPPFWAVAVYVLVWAGALLLLQSGQSSAALFSPWQAIDGLFLPLYFVLTVFLGALLFSRFKIKTLLILIILHSFLMHAYLPLSHTLPWGGDVWRMIAVEEQLAAGEFVLPVIAGPEAQYREFFGVSVPEALLIPHKYIYGQLWGTSVLAHHTLNIDLITINRWLVPILWSLFFPIFIYRIGRLLFHDGRYSVWLAGATIIPFTFQALGALTLGVSIGTLMFTFFLMLYLQYLRDRNKKQLAYIFAFALAMIFSYTLHFLFMWVLLVATGILLAAKKFFRSVPRKKEVTVWKWIFGCLGVSVAAIVFPLLEVMASISHIPTTIDIVSQGKQLLAQASGFIFASRIIPGDLLTWNILFNHIPEYAFVSNLFTDMRWHVLVGTIIAAVIALWGLMHVIIKEKDTRWQAIGILSAMVFGGYIIGWFFLEGDRSFIRRFDSMVGLLLLLLVFYGCSLFDTRRLYRRTNKAYVRMLALIIIVFTSWIATTTYASGPDMRVVSSDEYGAAEYVWQSVKDNASTCVIADTWPLLALEAISHGQVVGGGFPIDYQFGQADRVAMYRSLTTATTSTQIVEESLLLTDAKTCSAIASREISQDQRAFISEQTRYDGVDIGSLTVWAKPLNNE